MSRLTEFNNLRMDILKIITNEEEKRRCEEVFQEYRRRNIKTKEEEDYLYKEWRIIETFEASLTASCDLPTLRGFLQRIENYENHHENSSLKLAILKGRAFKILRAGNTFSDYFQYSRSYVAFLRRLYNFYLQYPFIADSHESATFFKINFRIISSHIKNGRRRKTFEEIMQTPRMETPRMEVPRMESPMEF